jgi:hypothetical protein
MLDAASTRGRRSCGWNNLWSLTPLTLSMIYRLSKGGKKLWLLVRFYLHTTIGQKGSKYALEVKIMGRIVHHSVFSKEPHSMPGASHKAMFLGRSKMRVLQIYSPKTLSDSQETLKNSIDTPCTMAKFWALCKEDVNGSGCCQKIVGASYNTFLVQYQRNNVYLSSRGPQTIVGAPVLVGSIMIYNCFIYVRNQYIIIDRQHSSNLTSIMMYFLHKKQLETRVNFWRYRWFDARKKGMVQC